MYVYVYIPYLLRRSLKEFADFFNKDMLPGIHYIYIFRVEILKIVLSCERRSVGEHLSRFNDPITNGVAVLMVGDRCENIDIVIHHKQKEYNELMN